MADSFFSRIEKKTGLDFEEILALANAISYADFSDERQVRKIVRKISDVANRPISKEMESKLVQSIVQDGQSLSFEQLERMMSQK